MNLMNNFVWSVAAGVLMVASAGCGKTDATPPTLEVVVAGVQPDAEVEVDAGSTVSVTVLVQDETELSQLRIDLHSASGHSHGGGTQEFVLSSGAWTKLVQEDLEGTSHLYQANWTVPEDVRGIWDLVIDAVDVEGNEAETVVMQVHVENALIPLFTLGTWAEDAVWTAGSTFPFEGMVSDADGLALVEVHIEDEEAGTVVWEGSWDAAGAVEFDLAAAVVTLPAGFSGPVHVHLHAEDATGRVCETGFEATVE